VIWFTSTLRGSAASCHFAEGVNHASTTLRPQIGESCPLMCPSSYAVADKLRYQPFMDVRIGGLPWLRLLGRFLVCRELIST
jgi:hypothetical protein